MEVVINRYRSVKQLAAVYCRDHTDMDQIFMDEFDFFIEPFSSRNGKLLICGNFNYWVDDPAHKPHSSEFMEFLNINNFENQVLQPTHTSGHTILSFAIS